MHLMVIKQKDVLDLARFRGLSYTSPQQTLDCFAALHVLVRETAARSRDVLTALSSAFRKVQGPSLRLRILRAVFISNRQLRLHSRFRFSSAN